MSELKVKEGIKHVKVTFSTDPPPHKESFDIIGIWPDEFRLRRCVYVTSIGKGWFYDDNHSLKREDPIIWAPLSPIFDVIE
jgi:hypothetical protein